MIRLAYYLVWSDLTLEMEERYYQHEADSTDGWLTEYHLMVFKNVSGESLYHPRSIGLDPPSILRGEGDPASPVRDGLPGPAADQPGTSPARTRTEARHTPPESGESDHARTHEAFHLDFTYYRGLQLSIEVLQWVYREAGIEWDWRMGARDVSLPEHVWAHLKHCWEEGQAGSELE